MRAAFGIAVGVFAVVAITSGLAAPPSGGGGGGGPPPGGGGPSEFEISGSVGPVYLFVDSDLTLKIENPKRFAILVTELSVTAGSNASAACTAENLIVEPVTVPFEVAAEGEVFVSTKVRIANDSPNECQSALFPLTFAGLAERP